MTYRRLKFALRRRWKRCFCLLPVQPGIKRLSVNWSRKIAVSTVSILPHVKPTTRIPELVSVVSSACEMAPHINSFIPKPDISFALAKGFRSLRDMLFLFSSTPFSNSIRHNLSDTSKTGDIEPCQFAIATIMT